ncbi:unnamed protein product, partial [Ilex paraguariensis]
IQHKFGQETEENVASSSKKFRQNNSLPQSLGSLSSAKLEHKFGNTDLKKQLSEAKEKRDALRAENVCLRATNA